MGSYDSRRRRSRRVAIPGRGVDVKLRKMLTCAGNAGCSIHAGQRLAIGISAGQRGFMSLRRSLRSRFPVTLRNVRAGRPRCPSPRSGGIPPGCYTESNNDLETHPHSVEGMMHEYSLYIQRLSHPRPAFSRRPAGATAGYLCRPGECALNLD